MGLPLQITSFAQGSLSISGVAAQTGALTRGYYAIWTTVNCYIKTNVTANDVTTASGFILYAGQIPDALLIEDGHKIGAITSGATGTLSYHRIG